MSEKLLPGDRVYFIQNGRKLRGVISDTLNLRSRGEELLVPVVRPQKRFVTRVLLDGDLKLKVRWLKRSKVRKLPTP